LHLAQSIIISIIIMTISSLGFVKLNSSGMAWTSSSAIAEKPSDVLYYGIFR